MIWKESISSHKFQNAIKFSGYYVYYFKNNILIIDLWLLGIIHFFVLADLIIFICWCMYKNHVYI